MGLQYLAADEVSQRFRDSTSGTPCQLMPYERILETRSEANEVLLGFLRNCKRELRLHDAFTGPLKDLTAAEKKAKRDYNGRSELVTDYVRGKVVVRTPEEIKALKQTLGNRTSDLMHNSGIYLVHMTDFFEDPKDLTGYRALNCKLAVPVSGGDYHVVELQVVAEQIEKIYDVTHPYKARAEALHASCYAGHGALDYPGSSLAQRAADYGPSLGGLAGIGQHRPETCGLAGRRCCQARTARVPACPTAQGFSDGGALQGKPHPAPHGAKALAA